MRSTTDALFRKDFPFDGKKHIVYKLFKFLVQLLHHKHGVVEFFCNCSDTNLQLYLFCGLFDAIICFSDFSSAKDGMNK